MKAGVCHASLPSSVAAGIKPPQITHNTRVSQVWFCQTAVGFRLVCLAGTGKETKLRNLRVRSAKKMATGTYTHNSKRKATLN